MSHGISKLQRKILEEIPRQAYNEVHPVIEWRGWTRMHRVLVELAKQNNGYDLVEEQRKRRDDLLEELKKKAHEGDEEARLGLRFFLSFSPKFKDEIKKSFANSFYRAVGNLEKRGLIEIDRLWRQKKLLLKLK